MSVGTDESMWGIGTNNHIYHWHNNKWSEPYLHLRGTDITVGDKENIAVITPEHNLLTLNPELKSWHNNPGTFRQASISPDNKLWALSTEKTSGGSKIYYLDTTPFGATPLIQQRKAAVTSPIAQRKSSLEHQGHGIMLLPNGQKALFSITPSYTVSAITPLSETKTRTHTSKKAKRLFKKLAHLSRRTAKNN